jgi:lysophospholipase L1-like esterase
VARPSPRAAPGTSFLLAGLVLAWCCAAAGSDLGPVASSFVQAGSVATQDDAQPSVTPEASVVPSASDPRALLAGGSASEMAIAPASPSALASPSPLGPALHSPTTSPASSSASSPAASALPAATQAPLIQDLTPPGKPRRFVVLGDSLSYWAFPQSSSRPSAAAWPYVLDSLASDLVLVHNSSVPGNTTSQMLARLKRDVFAYHPDVLFILGGTNDVSFDWPVATTVANLRAIIRSAKARGIEVVVLTVPPSNQLYSHEVRRLLQVNGGLKRVAAAEGVRVIDVFAALTNGNNYLPNAYVARDHLHLTVRGERVVAETVCQALYPLAPEGPQS